MSHHSIGQTCDALSPNVAGYCVRTKGHEGAHVAATEDPLDVWPTTNPTAAQAQRQSDRVYLAGQALAAHTLVGAYGAEQECPDGETVAQRIARDVVAYADAVIAELAKPKGDGK